MLQYGPLNLDQWLDNYKWREGKEKMGHQESQNIPKEISLDTPVHNAIIDPCETVKINKTNKFEQSSVSLGFDALNINELEIFVAIFCWFVCISFLKTKNKDKFKNLLKHFNTFSFSTALLTIGHRAREI